MLSFCTVKYIFRPFYEMINLIFRQFRLQEQIKKYKSLQVRIPLVNCFLYGRKRVSFSAFMTVEAAFALPLFLFAGVILMMPLRILDVERQVQASVEMVGEDISRMIYMASGETPDTEVWTEAAALGYAEAAVRLKLGDLPVEKVSLLGSELLRDGKTLDLVVDYGMRMPFPVFGMDMVKRRARCYRRGWIGQDEGNAEADNLGEMIVYVGRDSTRYHVSKRCHYLSNDLQTVKAEQIGSYRNSSGERYKPCSTCGDFRKTGDNVYIMNSGERYHTTAGCPSIRSYATAVLKSDVEHLGGCSYCSKGE